MIRASAAVLVLALTGCGGALANGTQTIVATLDTTASKQEIDDLASSAGAAAGTALRDAALSPETTRQLNTLVAAILDKVRAELLLTRDQLLGPALREEVRKLRDAVLAGLDVEVRRLVRAAIDEALSRTTLDELSAAREQLAGAPLRADIIAAADTVRQETATVRAEADAEIARYRGIALVAAFAAAALIVLHIRRELLERR